MIPHFSTYGLNHDLMLYLSCVQLVLTRNKSYYLVIFITNLLLFPAVFSVSNRMSPLGGRLAPARLIDILSIRAHPLRDDDWTTDWAFISSLCFLNLSLLSDSLLACSSFPGGDDWASGGAIRPVFSMPFAGDERLQVCLRAPSLSFCCARRSTPNPNKTICIRI